MLKETIKSVRWDIDNILCLCVGCHFWAHKNPIFFTEFVRARYTVEKYDELKLKAGKPRHWELDELAEIFQKYQVLTSES